MSRKAPTAYPISKPTKPEPIKNPYKTLGVKNTDSLETINASYKKLIFALHPDKALTKEALQLGWSVADKNDAFNSVKTAYEEILKLRKTSDFPDYNIDYYINEELKIRSMFPTTNQQNQQQFIQQPQQNQQQTVNKPQQIYQKVAPEIFNKAFEQEQRKNAEEGLIIDPYAKGYSDFGRTSEKEANAIFRSGSRADIPVPKSKKDYKFDEVKLGEDGRLINYVPKDTDKFGLPTHKIGYAELGLTVIDDFSVKSTTKGPLCGTDLTNAYSNQEYWEDVALSKDIDLYNKYNDKTDLNKMMSQLKTSRVDKFEIDPVLQEKLNREAEQEQMLEDLRQMQQKKQDLYIDKMAGGRVSYQARR